MRNVLQKWLTPRYVHHLKVPQRGRSSGAQGAALERRATDVRAIVRGLEPRRGHGRYSTRERAEAPVSRMPVPLVVEAAGFA